MGADQINWVVLQRQQRGNVIVELLVDQAQLDSVFQGDLFTSPVLRLSYTPLDQDVIEP